MKIERYTDEVEQEINSRLTAGLFWLAPMIVKSAKRISPIDTGLLRRSIQADIKNLTLTVGSQVPYAHYVEGGTTKWSGKPYLRPALMENVPNIKKVFKAVIK